MVRIILGVVLIVCAFAMPVLAQERTAAGAIETQMTWTSLKNIAELAVSKADGVDARVNQSVICNRKSMAYAPGSGADGDGCIENSKITTLITRADNADTKLGYIGKCGAAGMVWDSTSNKCKDPKTETTKPSQLNIQTRTQTACLHGGQHQIVARCASGEELLSCAGGPGDQKEAREYWSLMPNFTNRSCTGYVGEPWCYAESYYGQTVVTAICYKP